MLFPAPGGEGSPITIKSRYDNFIGGAWVPPVDGRYFENPSPVDGKTFCEVARGTAADIELASQETAFGPAVCSINGTGCPADNCFCNEKEFWAYFHLAGGEWASAMEGVGAYVPADGTVEGFAWSASDADFNPTVKPNVVTFEQMTSGAAAAATGAGLSMQTIVLLVALVALIAVLVALYLRRTRR